MPFFETETTGNWCVESCTTEGVGELVLIGAAAGFVRFNEANNVGEFVWYSVTDDANREAGIGQLGNNVITRLNVTSTLLGGVYTEGENLTPIPLSGDSIVAGTFNAASFNELWAHIWRKDNPHEVDWDSLLNKPTTFPPSAHTHVEADVTDLDKYTKAEVDALIGGASGEINTGSNVGTSNEVFKQKTGVDLEFRTLTAGNNIAMVQNANDIKISSTGGGGSGEINDGDNLGAGSEVFAQKVGVDLQFRTLTAGSNVSLVQSADEIEINSTGGGGGGTGELLFTYTNNTATQQTITIEDADISGTLDQWEELNLVIRGGGDDGTNSWDLDRTRMQLAANSVYRDSYQIRVWDSESTPYPSGLLTDTEIPVASADDNSWTNYGTCMIYNRPGNSAFGPFVISEFMGADIDGPNDLRFVRIQAALTSNWTTPFNGIRLVAVKRFATVKLYGMR